jgi:hypothetical protein
MSLITIGRLGLLAPTRLPRSAGAGKNWRSTKSEPSTVAVKEI